MSNTDGSTWPTVRLGTLAEFRNGINYNKDNFGKGIRVINVKDFQDHSVAKFDDLDEINPDGVIRDESLLKNDDIIFVRSNGNRQLIGRSMIIKDVPGPISHSAFSIKLRFTSTDVLPRFYAYLFRTQLIRQVLSAHGGGTNIANLNQTILNNLEVPLPPVRTQRKIASILSAYDDLIENNTRRIAILEEMAQAIYREWFVHFRFPGHENVKLVDSPLGQIPEGWRFGKLNDILTLQRGFDLPLKKRVEGDVPVFAATGVTGYHNEAKVKAPGVLTGRSGSLGTVSFVHEDFWPLNTTLWVKTFSHGTALFAYYVLSGIDFEVFNSGAAVPSLNRNNVHGLPVVLPPDSIIDEFTEIGETLFRQAKLLRQKNSNLRATRDLLLPKLISGKLDVEDLDIETGKLTDALNRVTA